MSDSRKQWLLKVIAGPHQGAEISLDEGKALVGSDDACDVVLHDVMIAPQHLELEFARNGIAAAPLGGRVFLNGKRIKDARQTVPDFAFISIGGSHLIIGPQDGKWPLLSAADVPELEKDAPAPEPETADSKLKVEAPVEEKKEQDGQPTPERRRAAWFGVVFGCLLLVAWLVAWQFFVKDLSNRSTLTEKTDSEKAREALVQLGVAEQIDLEESGGKINATGYVDTEVKQREVQSVLRETVPGIRIRVWSLEKVVSSARSLIVAQKIPLQVSSLQEGELKVSGVLPTVEEWDRVRQLLLSEIPGLSGIEDQVRIEPAKSTTTPAVVRQQTAPVETKELSTPATPASEPLPGADATVVSITSNADGLGWMKISTGNVYFQGGQLPVGGTIIAITKDTVSIVENGRKRELRRGEPLGNNPDRSLQTIATPSPLVTDPIP